MSNYLKIGLSIAVIAALGVGGVKAIQNAKKRNESAPKAKIYPIVVTVITPKITEATLTLPFLAEVANDKDVKLSSRIAARIRSIMPSGSSVKQGDIVARLDTTEIKSSLKSLKQQLDAANISLSNINSTHKRTLELLKVKGASVEESQKEETIIANTKAQISTLKQKEVELKNNLSYVTILSPVDGVIAKTFENKGAISMPGQPLIQISSDNGFYLMVKVPADLPIKGIIFNSKKYLATSLGSTFHGLAEYKVYVKESKLTTGDRIEANVIVFNKKANLLPFDAILNRNGKNYVLVVNGDKAEAKEVHVVQSGEEGVVIKESLTAENIVVAKPDVLLKLTSGYALKVKE